MKFNFLTDKAYFIFETHSQFISKDNDIILLGMEDIVPDIEIDNNRVEKIGKRGIVLRCGYFKKYNDEKIIDKIYKQLSENWFDKVHKEYFKLRFSYIEDYCYARINKIEVIKENKKYIEFNIEFDIRDSIFIEKEKVEEFIIENNNEIVIDNGMIDTDYLIEISGENNQYTDIDIVIDKYNELKDVKLISFKNIKDLKIDLYNQSIIIDGIDKVEEYKDMFSIDSINICTTLSKRLPNGEYRLIIKINNNKYQGRGILRYTPTYIL